MIKAIATVLSLSLLVQSQSIPPSHIPPAVKENEAEAAFVASASKLISGASIDEAWNALIDFSAYPQWNPFVRSQVLANKLFFPLDSQTPADVAADARLIIQVQIPPLPLPVSESTPANPLNAQSSLENITYFEPSEYLMAWKQIMIPDTILNSTRWTALSEFEGQVYYETYEAYFGPLAYIVKDLFEEGLQEGFEAQGEALQLRLDSV